MAGKSTEHLYEIHTYFKVSTSCTVKSTAGLEFPCASGGSAVNPMDVSWTPSNRYVLFVGYLVDVSAISQQGC
jgi:hypothetical protein